MVARPSKGFCPSSSEQWIARELLATFALYEECWQIAELINSISYTQDSISRMAVMALISRLVGLRDDAVLRWRASSLHRYLTVTRRGWLVMSHRVPFVKSWVKAASDVETCEAFLRRILSASGSKTPRTKVSSTSSLRGLRSGMICF